MEIRAPGDAVSGAATVGPRSVPLGGADTLRVDARETGTDCTGDIPMGALSLALNVTASNATERTFFTMWADGPRPIASSLNPAPGEPPTPNAVTVDLAADQSFRIYNESGDVNVIVDVAGYDVDHNHDDRCFTETEIDARFNQQKIIQLPTRHDLGGDQATARRSPLEFEASFVVPPDHTTGTDMRLQIVYDSRDVTPTACVVTIEENCLEGYRPSTNAELNDDGGSVTDGIELGTQNQANFSGASVGEFATLNGVISQPGTTPFEPGDAINIGLFVAGSTCDAGTVGTFSATIHYD